jgi:homocitrate synthase
MSLTKFAIIDSTLREGEQFSHANFSTDDKVEIATALDDFGVEYIELTSPYASPQSEKDCKFLARLGLKAKILTHIRCHLEDAKVALETGVDGINLVIGTSNFLRQFGHGKSITQIIEVATEVITFIHKQRPEIELRFSTEDSFRCSTTDLLQVYSAIAKLGMVNRFGVADTVGVATPNQVSEVVKLLVNSFGCDIEFHGHNDTGCAIANSYVAIEAGGTHINTTVLGIGERNGITPLAGLIARLYTFDPEELNRRYCLSNLLKLNQLVADKVGMPIPFNHYIVGESSFCHKAGIHTKAILNNPSTYEVINPNDFGLERSILINHKLTGRHALAHRASKLGLNFNQHQINIITREIKSLAEQKQLTEKNIDEILFSFNSNHILSSFNNNNVLNF